MFQKAKDVVMTIGSSVAKKSKALYDGFINKVRSAFQSKTGLTAGAGLALVSASSHAESAIDVSSALSTFGDVNTAIPLVGAAFLAALGILAAWKLIRGAFA